MNKFDLQKLETSIAGEGVSLHALSPETIALCLMATDDRAIYRGAWLDDDGPISDSRWDDAAGLVHRAKAELIAPTVEIDGGNA